MTPERLQEIRAFHNERHMEPAPLAMVEELLDYIDLLGVELHLHKTQMRTARAIAWDAGAQAGLDWDKNHPDNIRDSNPFKETK